MRKRRSDYKPRVQASCANCGTAFETTAYRVRTGHGKYCSKPCQKLGRQKRTEVPCATCSKTFELWPCEVLPRNFCSRACFRMTDATKAKLSKIRKGRPAPWVAGDKCHFWKGGITPEHRAQRMSLPYRQWREAVFKRDNYTCQACGVRGGRLEADHELPFALYPDLRFEVLNGRTFCVPCHKKTPTYGKAKIAEYEQLLTTLQ